MAPTTVCSGSKFKPAIQFDDGLYVLDAQYAQEKQAYAVAHRVYNDAKKDFINNLRANEFHLRAIR